MFDDDGILIRFMNNNTQGNGIRDAASAAQLISQVNFNGLTPLGTNLISKVGTCGSGEWASGATWYCQ